jgi:hypothetical protein
MCGEAERAEVCGRGLLQDKCLIGGTQARLEAVTSHTHTHTRFRRFDTNCSACVQNHVSLFAHL